MSFVMAVLFIDEGVVHWVYENSRWATKCGIKFSPAQGMHRRSEDLTPTCLICVARSLHFIL